MATRIQSRKYRLFKYAQCCVQAGKVIDDYMADGRNLISRDAAGRIVHVSDDLIDLGNYTERGHRRLNPETVQYFN